MANLEKPNGRFVTTRWRLVFTAADQGSPAARAALDALCAIYYHPVFAVFRVWRSAEEARDLTQGFFMRLLEKNDLTAANPGRGRFRCWLRKAMWSYLLNDEKRARALIRGGGKPLFSLDAGNAEGPSRREPAHDLTPERIHDRRRALTLLARVLDRLRDSYERRRQGPLFEKLKLCLVDGTENLQRQIAAELGKSEVCFRQDVYRFKRRYRKLLDAALAESGGGNDRIEEERRHLREALRSDEREPESA